MTTEVDVVNIALTLLGANRIVALTDSQKEARETNAIFAAVRDELMSRYNWTFAKKRGQATGADAPPFGFTNAFDLPSDCLRVVRPGARYAGPDLTDYRLGPVAEYSIEGRQILTDWPADGQIAPADSDKVASIEILTQGVSWTDQPLVTVAAPPPGGTTAHAVAYLGCVGAVPNATIPGSGYAMYNELTIQGGTPNNADKAEILLYRGLGVGAPLRYDVINPGEYTALPGITDVVETFFMRTGAATTGGAGVNAQVDTWWRPVRIEVTDPGSGYVTAPAVTVTAPLSTGSGCTAQAILGDPEADYLNIVYIARKEDPNDWDPFFVKLMGAQLAMDLCEPLTQSTSKYQKALDYFTRIFRDAVRNNAIQLPPDPQPDDSWMMSRR